MSRAYLPNPDHVWPEERTFADICNEVAEERNGLAEQLAAIEERFKEWSDKLDQEQSNG